MVGSGNDRQKTNGLERGKTMANYTFDIIRYKLITEKGNTYKDFIEEMPSLVVEATNYISATLKAEKAYPSDKYTHKLIDTDTEKWPSDTSMF